MKKEFNKKTIYFIVALLFISVSIAVVSTQVKQSSKEPVLADVSSATIVVHHYEKGTTHQVHADDTYTKNFNDSYTTTPYDTSLLTGNYKNNYFYNNEYTGDARSGVVGKANYEITYFYELREAEIITNHFIEGTETPVHNQEKMYKKFTQVYETSPLETEELYERYQNIYVYKSTSGDATTDTVSKAKYIINYYYVPRKATITVHHYEVSKDGNKTTNKVHVDDTITKDFNDNYTTSPYNTSQLDGTFKNNYYFNNETGGDNTLGTVNTDRINVIYYYEAIPSTITVHHYIKGTTTKVHADDVINKVYTDSYTTRAYEPNELTGIYQNNYYYNHENGGDSLSGTVNKGTYEIIYYYELRPSTITVHHYVKGTETSVHVDDVINKKYTDEYTITPYTPEGLEGSYRNNYYYHDEYIGDALSGVIEKDNYEITIYYEQRPSLVTVHHYIKGTTTKVLADEHINKFYGDSYETQYYSTGEIDNPYKNVYCHDNTTGGDSVNGTVNKDNIDVIYYYDLRPATVTIHHYIIDTEIPVHADVVLNKKFTQTYESEPFDTSELEGEYKNWYEYKSLKAGDTPSATIIGETYEVTYYYDKRPAKVIVHHYIKDTETQLAEDEIINLKLKDHYETSRKADSELNMLNYTYDSVVGVSSGDIEELERVVTYYYKLKPAKLIVHHIAEDTEVSLCPDVITDVTYQDFYTVDSCPTLNNINYTYKNVVTNDERSEQRGTKLMGNILQDRVEITYYYELKPGQIVIHYFEAGTTNRVADDVISDGLASKEFVSEIKEIEGFTLVKKPESNVHTYQVDTQEFIYEYERNKYRIGIEVIGGVGSVTGSEEVLYGSDSTEGALVITPSDGYEIGMITIDGVELEDIVPTGMTLDVFKNVSKDHKVEVTFKEKEMPVPITGSNTALITIALILFVVTLIYISMQTNVFEKVFKRR